MGSASPAGRSSENSFEISFRPLAGGPTTFAVAEKNDEQFAAELDVLVALIRTRVIRARKARRSCNFSRRGIFQQTRRRRQVWRF